MILSPCINTGKKYYTGDGHLEARTNACLCELIDIHDSRDFMEGYLSDTKDYKTQDGKVFAGWFRDRFQAFEEAKECGQLIRDTKLKEFKYNIGGRIDLGLDSTQVITSGKQRIQAKAMAESICTYDIMHAEGKRTEGNISQLIEYYR